MIIPGLHLEKTFTVRHADCDMQGCLAASALCGYLQEVAISHADILGVGMKALLEGARHTWMLARLRVQFAENFSVPYGQKVRVLTWPAGNKGRTLALRDFFVTDEAGHEILRGESEWLYVNIERLRVARLTEEILALAPPSTPRIEIPDKEIPEPATENFCSGVSIVVRRSDLDLNNHVNHIRYIEWLFESLPSEFYAKKISALDISYRQGASLGETLNNFYAPCYADMCHHRIERDGILLTRALTTW